MFDWLFKFQEDDVEFTLQQPLIGHPGLLVGAFSAHMEKGY